MTHAHARRPLVILVAIVVSLLIGGGAALQARINGELGVRIDDGIVAALISFTIGMTICLVGLAAWPRGRRGLVRVRRDLAAGRMSPWYLGGGAAGGFMVATQGLTVGTLGVALFIVATVGGSTIGSLLVDRRGVGTMSAQGLSLPRVAGALLAFAAVGWAVSDRIQGDVPWWMLVIPFLAGGITAWQQAVNGQLRQHAGSALSATFVSFLVGTVVLALVTIVRLAVSGAPDPLPGEPWLYAGGLLGVTFVALSTVIVPITGVLVFILATIAGQLAAALVIDVVAPTAGSGITVATVGGVVLAMIAVTITALRRPRRTRVRRPSRSEAP